MAAQFCGTTSTFAVNRVSTGVRGVASAKVASVAAARPVVATSGTSWLAERSRKVQRSGMVTLVLAGAAARKASYRRALPPITQRKKPCPATLRMRCWLFRAAVVRRTFTLGEMSALFVLGKCQTVPPPDWVKVPSGVHPPPDWRSTVTRRRKTSPGSRRAAGFSVVEKVLVPLHELLGGRTVTMGKETPAVTSSNVSVPPVDLFKRRGTSF